MLSFSFSCPLSITTFLGRTPPQMEQIIQSACTCFKNVKLLVDEMNTLCPEPHFIKGHRNTLLKVLYRYIPFSSFFHIPLMHSDHQVSIANNVSILMKKQTLLKSEGGEKEPLGEASGSAVSPTAELKKTRSDTIEMLLDFSFNKFYPTVK
jgi:hypothetical protein